MKTSPPAGKAVVEMTGGRIWVPNKGKPKMGCFGRSGRTLCPRYQAEITAHVGAGRGCWLCPLHPRCQAALRQPFSAWHVDCQVNTLRAESKCECLGVAQTSRAFSVVAVVGGLQRLLAGGPARLTPAFAPVVTLLL